MRYPFELTRRRAVGAACLAVLVGAGLASGCSRPLLSPDNERSHFDRYDSVRSQYADQYTFDAFGRRQPNLRARLSPRQ
ncbi:MAG: hypothetical protein AAGK04_13240 [Planctomycetota bacterium]